MLDKGSRVTVVAPYMYVDDIDICIIRQVQQLKITPYTRIYLIIDDGEIEDHGL